MITHNPDFETRRRIAEQIISADDTNPLCVTYVLPDGGIGVLFIGDSLDNARMATYTAGALIDYYDTEFDIPVN